MRTFARTFAYSIAPALSIFKSFLYSQTLPVIPCTQTQEPSRVSRLWFSAVFPSLSVGTGNCKRGGLFSSPPPVLLCFYFIFNLSGSRGNSDMPRYLPASLPHCSIRLLQSDRCGRDRPPVHSGCIRFASTSQPVLG